MPSGPLDLWMSKEDTGRLTAVWLNLTSGIELWLWSAALFLGHPKSSLRQRERPGDRLSLLPCQPWTKMSFTVRNGGSEGWLELPSAAFESAQN